MASKKADPGELRLRLTFSEQTIGGAIDGDSWADFITVWGNVRPKRSKEMMMADGVNALSTHTAIVRWNPVLLNPGSAGAWMITYFDFGGVERKMAITSHPTRLGLQGEYIMFDCTEGIGYGN